MLLFRYNEVPVLPEDHPGAVLARRIIELIDDSESAFYQKTKGLTYKHYITSCQVAPYVTLAADEPDGMEISVQIKLVKRDV